MNIAITKNKAFRQTVALYTSMIVSALVSIAVSAFNTRVLGPEGYGDYRFLLNLFVMTITCISVGVFLTGGRLIAAESSGEIKKRIMAAQSVFVAIFFLIMGMFFFVIADAQEKWFGNELGNVINLIIPLLLVLPLDKYLECTLKGDNRIYSLSFIRVAPGILY